MSSDFDDGESDEGDVRRGVIGAMEMVGLLFVAVVVWWLLTVRPCPPTWLEWPRWHAGETQGSPTLIEE